MTADLESRVRRLEDRASISECVIRYGVAVDRRDWQMFGECFTDPVHTDYSENGMPAAKLARAELVAIVSEALERYPATQHLSPNHVIEFDDNDDDRATCHSYMYAQHQTESGAVFILRGSYTNRMRRTADGWRIEDLIQHLGWSDETRLTA
jgi:3-phenylpropionate/cinnamic acid dioxygenase small subunit